MESIRVLSVGRLQRFNETFVSFSKGVLVMVDDISRGNNVNRVLAGAHTPTLRKPVSWLLYHYTQDYSAAKMINRILRAVPGDSRLILSTE